MNYCSLTGSKPKTWTSCWQPSSVKAEDTLFILNVSCQTGVTNIILWLGPDNHLMIWFPPFHWYIIHTHIHTYSHRQAPWHTVHEVCLRWRYSHHSLQFHFHKQLKCNLQLHNHRALTWKMLGSTLHILFQTTCLSLGLLSICLAHATHSSLYSWYQKDNVEKTFPVTNQHPSGSTSNVTHPLTLGAARMMGLLQCVCLCVVTLWVRKVITEP